MIRRDDRQMPALTHREARGQTGGLWVTVASSAGTSPEAQTSRRPGGVFLPPKFSMAWGKHVGVGLSPWFELGSHSASPVQLLNLLEVQSHLYKGNSVSCRAVARTNIKAPRTQPTRLKLKTKRTAEKNTKSHPAFLHALLHLLPLPST